MFKLEAGVGLKFWGFAIRVVGEEFVLDIFGSDAKIKLQAKKKRKTEKIKTKRI